MSDRNLFRQSLGMNNWNDRIVDGSEDFNRSGVMPQGFYVIPGVSKHEADREKIEPSRGDTCQGIERHNQNNLVRRNFLLSKSASRAASNRFTHDTNLSLGIFLSEELVRLGRGLVHRFHGGISFARAISRILKHVERILLRHTTEHVISVRSLTGVSMHHQPNRMGICHLSAKANPPVAVRPRSQPAGKRIVRREKQHRPLPKVNNRDENNIDGEWNGSYSQYPLNQRG